MTFCTNLKSIVLAHVISSVLEYTQWRLLEVWLKNKVTSMILCVFLSWLLHIEHLFFFEKSFLILMYNDSFLFVCCFRENLIRRWNISFLFRSYNSITVLFTFENKYCHSLPKEIQLWRECAHFFVCFNAHIYQMCRYHLTDTDICIFSEVKSSNYQRTCLMYEYECTGVSHFCK